MKRAVIYVRVSTADQHPETQMLDLITLAKQRGFQIVGEYQDIISGAKAKRPGLDQLMKAARRRQFDVLLVWAFDRIARSTKARGAKRLIELSKERRLTSWRSGRGSQAARCCAAGQERSPTSTGSVASAARSASSTVSSAPASRTAETSSV